LAVARRVLDAAIFFVDAAIFFVDDVNFSLVSLAVGVLGPGEASLTARLRLRPALRFDLTPGRIPARSVRVGVPFVEQVASTHTPPEPCGDELLSQLLGTRRDEPRELVVWDQPVGEVVRGPRASDYP
jgi:hypothetical protein